MLRYDVTYNGVTARGNPTTKRVWLNTTGTYLASHYTYDIGGNTMSATDANGHATAFSYNDSYSDGQNRNTYGFPTAITNALNQQTTIQYDYGPGKPTSSRNIAGQTTTYAYNDPLDRMTQTVQPGGAQTNITYRSPVWRVVYQDQKTPGDGAIQTQTVEDGLGRPIEQRIFDDATHIIAADTNYDALGRVFCTSNPTRVYVPTWSSDGLNYLTCRGYDGLGRMTAVTGPDGSMTNNSVTTTTSYSGNTATVTDPAKHAKQTTSDGLGRVTGVVEDATGSKLVTQYAYDALSDLIWVNKCSAGGCGSGQARGFSYDSLGRLTQANNPESGVVSYKYDNASNLVSRTDARSITSNFTYDALDRPTGRTYTDGVTPAVSYTYDTVQVGQLSQTVDGGVAELYPSYDPMGRPLQSQLAINGQTYSFRYGYDLAGELTSETYPSGRVISTAYQIAGRPVTVSGTGEANPYVSNASYWPHGAPNVYQFGNNVWPVNTFTNALEGYQTYSTIGNSPNYWLLYVQNSWNTNGTLNSMGEGYGPGVTWGNMTWLDASYGYDNLNRLTGAQDSHWIRNFGYDEYGNMAVVGNFNVGLNGLTPVNEGSSPYNAANNRLLSSGYDAAGNMTGVGTTGITYDAENRQTKACEGASCAYYSYDTGGQRIQIVMTGGPTTVYAHDAFGQLAAEYSTAAPTPVCVTCYLSYDHLGSVRMVTDQNGNVVSRHDYLPYGEEIANGTGGRLGNQFGAASNVNQMFTGQERDTETTPPLDFFNARYLGTVLGSFLSPDPGNAGADLTNPQSWNGYSYVQNDPLNSVDPSGTCDVAIYGITMNPGDSSLVTGFSAGKVAVFPYEGTNIATGVVQVIGGGGDVNATIQGIRSAIAQTPAGQSVNIFAFSGGTQTLASAWGSLTSPEQARIGNITYSIPGSFTGALSFSGTLPRGSTNPMMIFPNANYEIPSGAPSNPYDTAWSMSCGHDVDCILKTEAALLEQRSGSSCSTSQVFPPPQPHRPASSGGRGGGGSASSTITYGPPVGWGPFGWSGFDVLQFLFPPSPPRTPPIM